MSVGWIVTIGLAELGDQMALGILPKRLPIHVLDGRVIAGLFWSDCRHGCLAHDAWSFNVSQHIVPAARSINERLEPKNPGRARPEQTPFTGPMGL